MPCMRFCGARNEEAGARCWQWSLLTPIAKEEHPFSLNCDQLGTVAFVAEAWGPAIIRYHSYMIDCRTRRCPLFRRDVLLACFQLLSYSIVASGCSSNHVYPCSKGVSLEFCSFEGLACRLGWCGRARCIDRHEEVLQCQVGRPRPHGVLPETKRPCHVTSPSIATHRWTVHNRRVTRNSQCQTSTSTTESITKTLYHDVTCRRASHKNLARTWHSAHLARLSSGVPTVLDWVQRMVADL